MNRPDEIRAFVDFEHHKRAAGQLRAQAVGQIIGRITPSRRAARTFALAFLLATGAFWAIILQSPPKTIAADPKTRTAEASSASGTSEQSTYILPEERWDAH
jgi:ferric-dicitrate binding protein FerR (iron transport regulator)